MKVFLGGRPVAGFALGTLTVNALTTSPTEASSIDTINAIYDYVRNQRSKIGQWPALLPQIQSFESWYQGLDQRANPGGVFGTIMSHTVNADDANEARRRRNAINAIIGQAIPADVTPADMPQTPPPVLPPEPNPMSIFEKALIAGAIAVAVVGGALVVYYVPRHRTVPATT
ncbi:MAG: hypothetical protein WAN65_03805 [Candidatus Sulfotelmatobacter sp.]